MSTARGSLPFDDRRARIRERANELVRAGADRLQASYQALEEAWLDEARENERLWDQADEIVELKRVLANFAQEPIAAASGSGLDTVGIYVRRGAVKDAVRLVRGGGS